MKCTVPASFSKVDVLFVGGEVDPLLLPRTLVEVKNYVIQVWVVNLSNKNIKLKNGIKLVSVEKCDVVITVEENRKENLELPDLALSHLKTSERSKVMDVLGKFPNLISDERSIIGTIPSIYHYIPTGDHKPICTRQYRLPEASNAVIKEECEQILKEGVIEHGRSPWLSPAVLVRKKDGVYDFV